KKEEAEKATAKAGADQQTAEKENKANFRRSEKGINSGPACEGGVKKDFHIACL
ncbi:hypothetical protein GWO25_03180, partial [Candidatus Saccharibacteria bacterium]|nr:hypothetical protein [Candidatus Saccharibacteria bacterium]